MFKKILIILFVVFIAFQFFQPELPEVITDNPNDLLVNNPEIPDDIVQILKNSCYDCHSNETNYPWYSYISPTSILVVRDINVGREELNFSDWESLSKLEKVSTLDDISVAIESDEMPMKIYTAIHWNASLSDSDKELMMTWTEAYADKLFE